jgi:hypothetical protein
VGTVGNSGIDGDVVSKIKQLIGKDPFLFYQWEDDKIIDVAPAMQDYFFNTR